ncbi:MAG TPA: RluA family pseudouridine synthase [Chitinophagales bacterium]|nr:RluA family pseudouridine synthase [Bacteroidota bacterium]MCB9074386.1 RluA family pseudouridine synthase [Chitinophagales bacterium]HMZ68439.1 RluA family pseudouridine synthase [Chitinophagales bacterium]HMZ94192.1 RluA family pseudouridine synthase [Chitinophagales bacterium]HND46571.1 RluA family pseudouridine synthase [Chitinophagales bacterium]
MALEVLYEDNHIIIVNKKSGDIVQADITQDEPLTEPVKRYLKEKYNKPGEVFLGVVHRIDRPVSGVVVFARTSKALSRMTNLFRTRDVKKTYWAVVKNKPEVNTATLIHYHQKDEARKRAKLFNKEVAHSKICELEYKYLTSSDKYHLLEVYPTTGRFHQIRAQLSKIGSPIKGDLKYGFERPNENASIHLHARSIEFIHPISMKEISIIAPVPKDDVIWQYFEKVKA